MTSARLRGESYRQGMSKRYSVQWRRPYRGYSLRRLNDEALSYRMQRRAAKLIRRALNGDTEALITLLKASGDLPHDYKTMY